jgi:hypothetical protein
MKSKINEWVKLIKEDKRYLYMNENRNFIKNYMFDFLEEDQIRFFFLILFLIALVLYISGYNDIILFSAIGIGMIIILILLRPDKGTIKNS